MEAHFLFLKWNTAFFLSALFSLLQHSVENPNQKRKKEKKRKNKRTHLLGITLVKKISYT